MKVCPDKTAAIAIRQVEKNTGASRNAFEQAAVLQSLGYRVTILAERARPDLIRASGVRYVHCWRFPFKGAIRRFWFNRQVQCWARRHAPTLLVSHGDVETPDVVYMHNCVHLASQRINKAPLPRNHEVAAIHDHVLSRGRFRRVAVNSRLMGDELVSRYGIPDHQIEISYPGYDAHRFNPVSARAGRDAVRQAMGVADHCFLVGLVTSGNFKKRNVDGLITLASVLLKQQKAFHFLIVGKDDPAPYQARIRQLGLEAHFSWRTTIDEVETLYGALDLFILPAHIEEFGRVALEAMACATPVMLSRYVGASELIADRWPDLVIDPDQVESHVSQILALLNDEARCRSTGEAMAELATHYSHEQQARKLVASFESLVDMPQG
ncbi:glycosyltransferase family 4 protein [Larsenimonas rhizosphaerae]|uniref:glycosyltransferase family 4 protein n=1 Tax=Larsenimonas rhizosphaerae TaxID=2944682 RepID=UPI0020337EA1|nr:glycosyltransferase family 4 protein [Larsenimonas rhizosphaerae]MCM2130743.1 glycosyltransferase family 4 protein [Larsenimonas rhizosphaerae]